MNIFTALLCGKRKENLRGGQLRKYGAYVKLGVRERKWQKWLGIGKRYMGVKIRKMHDCNPREL